MSVIWASSVLTSLDCFRYARYAKTAVTTAWVAFGLHGLFLATVLMLRTLITVMHD
jgi:hypothetical protein